MRRSAKGSRSPSTSSTRCLRARYHAVIFATGAIQDARLAIPDVDIVVYPEDFEPLERAAGRLAGDSNQQKIMALILRGWLDRESTGASPNTCWNGWLTLDAHERGLGDVDESSVTRERVKVVPRQEQVSIARDSALSAR